MNFCEQTAASEFNQGYSSSYCFERTKFSDGDRVLGYNIITVPNRRYEIPIQTGFFMMHPIVRSKYRHLYQFWYVNISSVKQHKNLLLLDDPNRVRSQIATVVRQIQRFDFDSNLVVTRKVII